MALGLAEALIPAALRGLDEEFHRRLLLRNREEWRLAAGWGNVHRFQRAERRLYALFRKPLPEEARAMPAWCLRWEEWRQESDPRHAAVRRAEERAREALAAYEPEVEGRRLPLPELHACFREEKQRARRRKLWYALRAHGRLLAPHLLRLRELRNAWARAMGYENFFHYRLAREDLSETQVNSWVQQMLRETEDIWNAYLDWIRELSPYRIPGDLMPWDFWDPYAQLPPPACDSALPSVEPLAWVRACFRELGAPVESILARSDLEPRAGKQLLAFCADIDRAGDVRVMMHFTGTVQSLRILLHELGHALYCQQWRPDLPYLLREPAHPALTEALALACERLLDFRQEARCPASALRSVVQLRWAAMVHEFERRFYAEDGEPEETWWELVSRYQGIQPPDPLPGTSWASKLHLLVVPVYHHNYFLGELLSWSFWLPGGLPELGARLQAWRARCAAGRLEPWTAQLPAPLDQLLHAALTHLAHLSLP